MIRTMLENRVFRAYTGGKRLDRLKGKSEWRDSRFPEEWLASCVRAINPGREEIVEGLSRCGDGTLLRDAILADPVSTMGSSCAQTPQILVKWLDSAERLFIQCHPTVEFAKEFFHSPLGKTESWYFLSTEKDACVYLGFREGITREEWKRCFDEQDTEGMLSRMHRVPVRAGDFVFVAGGVPHAIGGGCLLCEVQEATDLMVIPERTSPSGVTLPDRKMHGGLGFDKMLDCFTYEGVSYETLQKRYVRRAQSGTEGITPLADETLTDRFRIDRVGVNGTLALPAMQTYCIMPVLKGECRLTTSEQSVPVRQGDAVFIDACTPPVTVTGDAELLRCYL